MQLLLAVTGFVSTTAGETVIQPASAVTVITMAFALLPALLMALSLPCDESLRLHHESDAYTSEEFPLGQPLGSTHW